MGGASQINRTIVWHRTFASQYISFFERDAELVGKHLTLEQIRAYGVTKGNKVLVDDVDSLLSDQERKSYDLMWIIACHAPHRFASVFDQRILVILYFALAGFVILTGLKNHKSCPTAV